ncbi:hypothetical protein Mboo_0462 [Methanoregula boonei 6A8]|jgi:hypothetical protein|uniref:Uncharacterized protein n=1 Tax=Methanoregula boonei (strain DSM 21154 / JCM 14090 / 6A8) TaxID=456442 RepID=A7I5G9_METB6|nr:hypothetical protein [Methanoregula boonei]ABS54980.1 hypothetical protein Mboo_0462 [Methanoregula boonei 6A8]
MAQNCSRTTKCIAAAIVAVVIISALTAFAYYKSNETLKNTAQWGLESTAGVMATQINASEIQDLKPGDENTPQYQAVAAKLRNMRSMDDHLLNAYILKVNTTDMSTSFLVDDLYPLDPSGSAKIGEVYNPPDKREILEALSGPTASPAPYTDQWGSFVSAYAPIDDSALNSNGNTYAVLGLDVSADEYTSVTDQDTWIILSGVISIIVVLGLIFILGRKAAADET